MTPSLISLHVLSTPPCCCHHSFALIKQKKYPGRKIQVNFPSLASLAAYILWEQSWQKAFEKFCEKFHLSSSELPAGKLCEGWLLFLVSQGISYSAQCRAVPVSCNAAQGWVERYNLSRNLLLRHNISFDNEAKPATTQSVRRKINCFLACSVRPPQSWPSTRGLVSAVIYHHIRVNIFAASPVCWLINNNSNPSDIDECREANACGANTLCNNSPGNYTCSCQEGYAGDPYTGVSIL